MVDANTVLDVLKNIANQKAVDGTPIEPVQVELTVSSIEIGTVDQGTPGVSAWKVDGSAVTQPVSGAFFPATQPISGTITANVGTGTQPISAASLPLPLSASTSALQTQPGVDIGDVTINNASGASAVNVQDGGNSLTVDGGVSATQSGTWTVQPGNTANTTPWKVDISQVAGATTVTAGVAGLPAVGGNAASASSDSGNPIKVGAVFNTSLPSVATGQRVDAQADVNGRRLVVAAPQDGVKATYAAAVTGLVTAASATDVFTIRGSATKTVRVTEIGFSGSTTSGSGVLASVSLIKRSTADTGGTSTNPTMVPHDSGSPAATALVAAYTANPTLGTTVGTTRSYRTALGAASVVPAYIKNDFGVRPAQAIVLRGTGEQLGINFNSATVTGPSFSFYAEWSEE